MQTVYICLSILGMFAIPAKAIDNDEASKIVAKLIVLDKSEMVQEIEQMDQQIEKMTTLHLQRGNRIVWRKSDMEQYRKLTDTYLLYLTVCTEYFPMEEKCKTAVDPWLQQFDKREQKTREQLAAMFRQITIAQIKQYRYRMKKMKGFNKQQPASQKI